MEISSGFKKKFRITLYIIIFIAVEIVFGYFTLKSRNLFLNNSVNYGRICFIHQVGRHVS